MPARVLPSTDKRARLGVIALIFALHAALIFGLRGTASLPDRESITYMDISNRNPAPPEPVIISKPKPSITSTLRNADGRTMRAEPAAYPKASPNEPAPADADTPAPATAPIPNAPLDLDRLRGMARQDERSRIKSPLERQRENERAVRTVETHLAEAAKRGARKNCQTDYAGYGLFAAIPLVYGTLTDDGCKWK